MDTQPDIHPPPPRCPLTAALEVIGGKWTLILLYFLSDGTRRFAELQRLMPDISHKVLTATLRDLERHGLVRRTVFAEVPPRVEYALTEHGRTAAPVIEAARLWGHRHLDRTAPARR
jgi:DNA-binding HxlR family transcriptional regulator